MRVMAPNFVVSLLAECVKDEGNQMSWHHRPSFADAEAYFTSPIKALVIMALITLTPALPGEALLLPLLRSRHMTGRKT